MKIIERKLLREALDAITGSPESVTPERIVRARSILSQLYFSENARLARIHTRSLAPRFALDYETGEWHGITDDLIDRWQEAFPNIDLENELKHAALWLKGPPVRHRKALLRFMWNWFGRKEPHDAIRKSREMAGLRPKNPYPEWLSLEE